jgi:large subunit ribosomal protein L14e
MAVLEPGRVVLKIAGREGGMYAVVVEPEKDGFVTVSGPKSITGVKRRKCSIFHVEPTEHVLTAGSDESLAKAWKSSGLIDTLGITVPEKRKGKMAEAKPKAVRHIKQKPAEEKKK